MATFSELEPHRAALLGHCYRMLGSAAEAEDAVQETLVRAWRSLDRFEARSSLRTWLYRIATRVCLDALADSSRRVRPLEVTAEGSLDDELSTLPASSWLEPIPDHLALPEDSNPSELVVLRESIRLAFVAALQHLPPRQRAMLILSDVLGWPASDVAACLETTVAAVNSGLQRARATVAARDTEAHMPLAEVHARLVDRYVEAFERYDLDALAALLREDATLSMPPYRLWLRGPATIREWMLGPGCGCRGSRLVRTAASGLPAFAQYRPAPEGRFLPWALIVLEPDAAGRIAHVNNFLDTSALFPRFGMPLELGPIV